MELWKFEDDNTLTSLKLMGHVLGIPSPKYDIDGSKVRDLFYEKMIWPVLFPIVKRRLLLWLKFYRNFGMKTCFQRMKFFWCKQCQIKTHPPKADGFLIQYKLVDHSLMKLCVINSSPSFTSIK